MHCLALSYDGKHLIVVVVAVSKYAGMLFHAIGLVYAGPNVDIAHPEKERRYRRVHAQGTHLLLRNGGQGGGVRSLRMTVCCVVVVIIVAATQRSSNGEGSRRLLESESAATL
jgi:hypothetical protein